MAVLIDDPDGLGDYVTLAVTEPDGSRRIQRSKIPVWDLTPPPDENVGKITLSLAAAYGMVWFEDGLGASQLDGTDLRLLGGWVTYGFTEKINGEAFIVLGNSGQARFANMTINDVQGDLLRNARIGRAQFGGLVRWGDRYKPTFRAGLGVQAASYDSRFMVGSSSTPGPESSVDVHGLAYFGAGVGIRLTDSLLLDLSGNFVSLLNSESKSVQLGVQIGYSWKPSTKGH